MCRKFLCCAVAGMIVAMCGVGGRLAAEAGILGWAPGGVEWQSDYAEAVEAARQQGKMLLIFFHRPGWDRLGRRFERNTLAAAAVCQRLSGYVCARLPLQATVCLEGRATTVLAHEAFAELGGNPGVAILDYAHRDTSYYGCVVSTLPLAGDCYPSVQEMTVLLDLPPGTPSQRSKEYLARIHGRPGVGGQRPPGEEGNQPAGGQALPETGWLTDYVEAMDAANGTGKMLFVFFFCDASQQDACRRLETQTLADPLVRRKLQDYVCLRLPLSATIQAGGEQIKVLEHDAFRDMLGRPGVAILDFARQDPKYHGRVISAFPLTEKLWYTPEQMATILELPAGTLTQRTLIYAVRTHPEKPASTAGQLDPYLAEEAESHAQYQAAIRLQGHHRWETRFHRINAHLPQGLSAREVCAESWPGENLVEAAIECVRCWRLSSGHWSAVRSQHHVYGYDMKRGANGVWYATGIFGGG